MDFNASTLVSGFNVSEILSDPKHYSEFICGHCAKMVSLDSVVCEPCSHPFCRKCLETIATKCFMKQVSCECPVCNVELNGNSMQVGAISVAARPLREAQPLAYKVLSLVQVECLNVTPHQCNWRGNYGDFLQHAVSHSTAARDEDKNQEECSPLNNEQNLIKHPNKTNASIETEATMDKKAEAAKLDERRNSLGSLASETLQGSDLKPSRQSPEKQRSDRQDSDSNLEPSGEQPADWNTSITSLGFWEEGEETNQPDAEDEQEDKESTHHSQEENREDEDSVAHDETVHLAEKCRKHANAKFNKGEFGAARKFYSQGIQAMTKIKPRFDEEFYLLADMHSNRAVTFFREKQFRRCIEDCERAIEFEPTLEKSWIRKWRGLMALGEFENALSFLQKASEEMTESKKIRSALSQCSAEMSIFRDAQELMDKAEIPKAKNLLEVCLEGCENIVLLTFSARVDMTLGESEPALEKVNKVLRLNPQYIDALELRGFFYFLAGNTEEAAHLLYETYNRHKESKQIKMALDRVKKTHAAYSKAQSAAERGQHQEAIEHFTTAIQESDPLPPTSILFATLRTERAESYRKTTQFVCALKDCQDVVSVSREYAPAWIVRSEVLVALGKAEDARKELAKARRTWGSGSSAIEEGYLRVDFEIRVSKVNDDLETFESELENGTCERLPALLDRQRRRSSNHSSSNHASMRNISAANHASVRNFKNMKKAMSLRTIDTSGMGLEGSRATRRGSQSSQLRISRSSSFGDDGPRDQREQRRTSRRHSSREERGGSTTERRSSGTGRRTSFKKRSEQ